MSELIKRHGVYRHADLHSTLAPKSVAVVGASASPAPFGSRVIAKMEEGGFAGPIYAVNPKYKALGERPCFPSISALPQVPDCVVIAVPREAVEPVVVECAERGVGGVVIFSSGYAETGMPARVEQQQRLLAICRKSGMRLIGPNCLGVLNYNNGFFATFGIAPLAGPPSRKAIGFISQSGGLAFPLAQALERGVCFSHVFTMGNACDVDAADLISYLADEPSCDAIACVFEGMSDPRRLIEAAEMAFAANKPLVVCKLGTGELGAAAVLSHTGSLAGSNAGYSAAFKRCGAVVVNKLEALIEATAFFSKAGRPSAPGIGVLATSGGACVMLADMAELHGVPLPQPAPATKKVLERVIPEFGSPKNPCDVTGQVQASPEALYTCVDALMRDESYGALVIPQHHASESTRERLKVFSEAATRHGKIVCSVWLPEWLEGPGSLETELDPHVALFRSSDRCFEALAAWNEREQWIRSLPRKATRTAVHEAAAAASKLITAAPDSVLTEREAKQVLALYGIVVVGETLAQSVAEAASAATAISYPVALKVESPDLPHKTEAGIIRLDLRNESQLRDAYAAVLANARKVSPPPRINGVLVQSMVFGGTEMMIGARIDALFGPMIMAGLGGTMVELLKDTAVELAPVTRDEAMEMLRRLKGAALLTGFRGSAPVDLNRFADAIVRVSELIADQRSLIREIDVNPVICSGERVVAVDALIVRDAAGG